MRVSTEPLARARKALNTLLTTRKLNFPADHGAICIGPQGPLTHVGREGPPQK